MTGSALLAIGLSWWQSLIAVIIGSLLATSFTTLNGGLWTDGQIYNMDEC